MTVNEHSIIRRALSPHNLAMVREYRDRVPVSGKYRFIDVDRNLTLNSYKTVCFMDESVILELIELGGIQSLLSYIQIERYFGQ